MGGSGLRRHQQRLSQRLTSAFKAQTFKIVEQKEEEGGGGGVGGDGDVILTQRRSLVSQ